MPIIRRVVWDWRATTFKPGAKEHFFDWPAIEVTYFLTTPEQRSKLDEVVKELQIALTRVEPEIDGLQLDCWYAEGNKGDDDASNAGSESEIAIDRNSAPEILSELRYLELGSMPLVNLRFPPGRQAGLDDAWDKCWATLQSVCTDEQVIDCETFYDVTPEELARALESHSPA